MRVYICVPKQLEKAPPAPWLWTRLRISTSLGLYINLCEYILVGYTIFCKTFVVVLAPFSKRQCCFCVFLRTLLDTKWGYSFPLMFFFSFLPRALKQILRSKKVGCTASVLRLQRLHLGTKWQVGGERKRLCVQWPESLPSVSSEMETDCSGRDTSHFRVWET